MTIKRDLPSAPRAVCNICGAKGGIIEYDTGHLDINGERLHLCKTCAKVAIWCNLHRQYHHKSEPHPRSCPQCRQSYQGKAGYISLCPRCRWEAKRLQKSIKPDPVNPSR